MQKSKLANIFLSVSFGILAVFPFAWGSMAAFQNFLNYQTFKFGALSLVFFIFLSLFLLFLVDIKIRLKDWVLLSLLIVITITIRVLSQNILESQPITDFQDAITKARLFTQGPYPDIRSARFPYWGFYKLTLSQVFMLFSPNFNTVKIFNIFLACITAIGVYFLGKKASGSKKFALASTAIYALYPADVLYKHMPTGEHIFTMLLPFVCLTFIAVMEKLDKKLWLSLILSLLTGLLLGLMDLYRPVGIILLIAFVMAMIVFKFIKNDYRQIFLLEKSFWFGIFTIAGLILGFLGTKMLGFAAIHNKTGYRPNTSGYGWTLRIGLDVEEGGLWNRAIYDRMIGLYTTYDEDYAKVNAILLEETRNLIAENKSQLIPFMFAKFNFTWKSDYDFFYWATVQQNDDDLLSLDPKDFGRIIMPITDAFHAFILLFSTIGAIYCVRKQREPIPLILALFIIGFSIMLLLTEVQQRYRSVLFSTLPIFVSYGLIGVNQAIKPLFNKMRH